MLLHAPSIASMIAWQSCLCGREQLPGCACIRGELSWWATIGLWCSALHRQWAVVMSPGMLWHVASWRGWNVNLRKELPGNCTCPHISPVTAQYQRAMLTGLNTPCPPYPQAWPCNFFLMWFYIFWSDFFSLPHTTGEEVFSASGKKHKREGFSLSFFLSLSFCLSLSPSVFLCLSNTVPHLLFFSCLSLSGTHYATCLYEYTYVFIHIYIYIYTCTYVYMYIYI